jgi:hypothetical protein
MVKAMSQMGYEHDFLFPKFTDKPVTTQTEKSGQIPPTEIWAEHF